MHVDRICAVWGWIWSTCKGEKMSLEHRASNNKTPVFSNWKLFCLLDELSAYTHLKNCFLNCMYVGWISGLHACWWGGFVWEILAVCLEAFLCKWPFLMGHCFGRVHVECVLTPSQNSSLPCCWVSTDCLLHTVVQLCSTPSERDWCYQMQHKYAVRFGSIHWLVRRILFYCEVFLKKQKAKKKQNTLKPSNHLKP